MSNAFGAFTSLAQGALGMTLSYYMFTLAEDAEPGLQKLVAYNAASWALIKALSSVMQILICYVLNPSLWSDIIGSLFGMKWDVQSKLVEKWCKNFENTGMRANYIGTIIAGVSTLIFSSMCDKLDSESHLWAMVLLMRFFDFLYNVAKVGDSKFKTSGVQNMFALWFIAIAMGVFIWSTGVVDATEEEPVSTMNRWFIGLSSAHLFVLLLIITIKSAVYGQTSFFGIEKLVKRAVGDALVVFDEKFFSAYVEEGLTTLVFSALFAIGSIAFHNEANKGHMLFVLLMLLNADIVSRNPITDAGLDDDDLPGGDRPGSSSIFASTRVLHLAVGIITALGFLSYDEEDGLALSLFVWAGVSSGLLKLAGSIIGLFIQVPDNVVAGISKKENEMEVGIRRLSSYGLLVSGAAVFSLLEWDHDPNEMIGLPVSLWLFILGVAARISDYAIDVSLTLVGENAYNAMIGNKNSVFRPSKRDPNEVRVPGVMLLCASSALCLCFAFTDNFEGENMQENVETMEDDMQVMFWLLFILLLVHGGVALVSMLAFYVDSLKYGALSTIELVRCLVSSSVLSLYAILIAHEWGGRELLLVGAVLYTAADVIGRNLV